MWQLATQKAVDDLVARWQTVDKPCHQVEEIVIIFAVDDFLEPIFALKRTNRRHLVLTIVIGLFGTDEALSKLPLPSFLIMHTHNPLPILPHLPPDPIPPFLPKMILNLITHMVQLQMHQPFHRLLPYLHQESVVNLLQNRVVKSGESFVTGALQDVC